MTRRIVYAVPKINIALISLALLGSQKCQLRGKQDNNAIDDVNEKGQLNDN